MEPNCSLPLNFKQDFAKDAEVLPLPRRIRIMTVYDYLIIGGGIAGVTAAETIREKSPTSTIGIISDEPYLLYSRVLIPSFLKRRISREQLFLRRTEDFTAKNIDLHLGQIATAVDTKLKAVRLESGLTFRYKKLLIASGGRVKPWGRKEDDDIVYRLQNVDDADRLVAKLPYLKNPLVIGASFISMEFLEIFLINNILPTLLVRDKYFLGNIFDAKGGELLQRNFERHGIKTHYGDLIKDIQRRGEELVVRTERLKEIICDIIGIGIGIDRRVEFLKDSGISLGDKSVKTDEYLRTNIEDIYAAGDVAEYYDLIFQKNRLSGNWTSAFLQGKRAGLNMVGKPEPFKNVTTYAITNMGFQITALGECLTGDKSVQMISRTDDTNEQYECFFLKDGVLIGASLINRFKDKPHLTKLIESRTPVEDYREKLESFEFDINTIPIVG